MSALARGCCAAAVLLVCATVSEDAGEGAAALLTVVVDSDDAPTTAGADELYSAVDGPKLRVGSLADAVLALAAEPALGAAVVEVRLAPGLHRLSSTLRLGPQHGSSEQRQRVRFMPLDHGPAAQIPRVSGGIPLPWSVSSDGATTYATVPREYVDDLLSLQLWRGETRMLVTARGEWQQESGPLSGVFVPEGVDALQLVESQLNQTHERRLTMWRCKQYLQHTTHDSSGAFASVSSRPILARCADSQWSDLDGWQMCLRNTDIGTDYNTSTIVQGASTLGDAFIPFAEGYGRDCEVLPSASGLRLVLDETPSEVYTLGVLPTLIELTNVNGITFEDIEFQHTSMATAATISSLGTTTHAMVRLQQAQDIRFSRCRLRHGGGHGLWLDDTAEISSPVMVGCEAADLGASIVVQAAAPCGLEIGRFGARLLGAETITL